MDKRNTKNELEMGNYSSNAPINQGMSGNSRQVFGVNKDDIDKIYDDYKNHLRESEFERLKAVGGINGFLQKLKSDANRGLCDLTNEKIAERVKEFDDNVHVEKPATTCCEYVWEALKDLMIRILIVAAIIQIVLGTIPGVAEDPSKEWVEGFSIVIAVFVVVSVGSITNWSKEQSFRALNKLTEDDLKVSIRRGKEKPETFHPDVILVGDVIEITYGNVLKVDGIIITASELEFDESPLTGESVKKKKVPYEEFVKQFLNEFTNKKIKSDALSSCLVYSGSRCSKGSGTMLTLRVGKNSEKGKIAATVLASQESEDSKSPLEEKLDVMAGDIGKFGLIAAVVTFVALIIRFGVGYHYSKIQYDEYIEKAQSINATLAANPNAAVKPLSIVVNPSSTVGNKILKIILLCIAIIVVAIPEGLPLAVTLSLAFAIAKMQKENNLVRFMTSCETMGTANFICSDKTGTLTTGKMTVTKYHRSDVQPLETSKPITASEFPSKTYYDLFVQSIALNIQIQIQTTEIKPKQEPGKKNAKNAEQSTVKTEISANSSDKAFYDLLEEKINRKFLDYEHTFFSNNNPKNIKKLPFDSEKKCMTTIIKHPSFNINGFRVFLKGGADETLKKVKYLYNIRTDKVELMTEDQRSKINEELKNNAAESLRNFVFCYKDVSDEVAENYHAQEDGRYVIERDDFIFIGMAGIKDPLKLGVQKAVESCQRAGIKVIMVTGDNIDTAISISKECSILTQPQYDEVRDCLNKVEKETNRRVKELLAENQVRDEANAVYEQVKQPKKINQEDIYKKCLLSYPNRPLYAIEGKELSERVGLVCLTCGKTLNDRFFKDSPRQIDPKYQEVVMKLTNEKGHEGSKKCYCLPNKELAKKFFKDTMKRQMTDDDEELFVKKEALGDRGEFEKIIKNLSVIARAKPEDKYLLVFGLRQYRNVVAVTGDGTNDAPALSKADVGFSMGIAGTDVAKDASDIILLDDNFCSIVSAVKWGRNIFDCIRKFIQFQLTVNITACLLVFITACIGNETPLNAIQMLWVNLIMDSLGSLALATEPPSETILLNKPCKRSEYPVTKKMWKHILIQSAVQLGLMLLLYLHGPQFIIENEPSRIAEAQLIQICFGDYPGRDPENGNIYILDGSENAWSSDFLRRDGYGEFECGPYGKKTSLAEVLSFYDIQNGNTSHMTIIFNTFVIYTLFNQINSRILDDGFNIFINIHKNVWFIVISLLEFGLHAIIVQLTQSVFKVSRYGLTGFQWGVCIGFGAITFLVSILVKFIPDSWCGCFDKLNERDEKIEVSSVPIDQSMNLVANKISENQRFYMADQNELKKINSANKQLSGSKKIMTKSDNMRKELSKKVSLKNPNKN